MLPSNQQLMVVRRSLVVMIFALLFGCASSGSSSARGHEIRIRYAEVEFVDRVQMPSAAPAGAVVGGFTGLLISRNKSGGRQLATGVGGAILGGVATRALEGERLGYQYRLRYVDGGTSQFITEKSFFRVGDCVAVERGQYANIRRVEDNTCLNGPARSLQAQHLRGAEQCHTAKNQLLDAKTEEEVELASRKVGAICN